jgi:alpha-tubulin suppressor-like RCC1 family protein
VVAWGWNEHGNLGTGDTENKAVPTLVCGLSDLHVKAVAAGGAHSIVIALPISKQD